MIITSTIENPIVPFQNKIHLAVQNLMESAHPDFYSTRPILSGSYLIKLLVAPQAYFSDYDFYFESQEKYNQAKTMLLERNSLVYSNTNCDTFALSQSNFHLQIINTYFGTPAEIISKHDIENVKVAYQNNSLFFTKNFLQLWIEGKLSLDTFQINDLKNPRTKYLSFVSTLSRIKKYVDRYNLELDEKTISMLFDLKNHLNQNIAIYNNFEKITSQNNTSYHSPGFQLSDYESVNYLLNTLINSSTPEFPEPIEF